MSSRSSSRQATAIRAPAAVTIKSTPDSAADTVSMVTRANRTAGHRAAAAAAEGALAAVSPQVVVRWVSGLRASSTNARRSRIRPRGVVVVLAEVAVAVVAVAVAVAVMVAAAVVAAAAAAAVRLTEVFSRSSPRNPQPL